MHPKIIVGLPAYNEEDSLGLLLEKIQLVSNKLDYEVETVVIDDGSTDKTNEILMKNSDTRKNLHVISHGKNKGLGRAIETLFNFVSNKYSDQDILITMDADNTHNPEIIPEMVNKMIAEQLDIVVASRFIAGGKEIGVPFIRKLYSRGAQLLLKIFYPINNISDYSCGFRGYNIGFLKKALTLYNGRLVTTPGFACMAEILARFCKIGLRGAELPLVLEYHLKKGKSKINVRKTILGYIYILKVVKAPL